MKRRKTSIRQWIPVLLSALLVLGVLTVFGACGMKDDGAWMKCHGAQTAVAKLGGAMTALFLLAAVLSNRALKVSFVRAGNRREHSGIPDPRNDIAHVHDAFDALLYGHAALRQNHGCPDRGLRRDRRDASAAPEIPGEVSAMKNRTVIIAMAVLILPCIRSMQWMRAWC